MKSNIPAFPTPNLSVQGMTLRDYFAAAALAGGLQQSDWESNEHAIAQRAFAIADAMLREAK